MPMAPDRSCRPRRSPGVAVIVGSLACAGPHAIADGREARAVFDDAVAVWGMASAASGVGELSTDGAVAFGIELAGQSRDDSLDRGGNGVVAELEQGAMIAGEGNAGALNIRGDAFTIALRLLNSTEDWNLTLFAKHGGHDRLQYNIYSFDRPGDQGAELGFEFYTTTGYHGVRPYVPALKQDVWHTIVGRYDGEMFDLFVNGVRVASDRATGRLRSGSGQPLIISGERVGGEIVRSLTGMIDHAAIWGRALSDDEIRLICPGEIFDPYTEPHRPQFHFTPPKNWMNDPNGLLYADGTYHLFYQHNPYDSVWGSMSWGHATSPDLLHWEHRPIALMEEGPVQMWSGSAVRDEANTTGLGRSGDGPLVAIYTQRDEGPPEHQTQAIAYSNDLGRTWTKYRNNPVLDIGSDAFRDPKVFWYEPGDKWVMAVVIATQRVVQFYESRDLKSWALMSTFGPEGAPDSGIWECPELFEAPVIGAPGETRWVLAVAVANAVAGATGAQYFVGHFDGRRFINENAADEPLWIDRGTDFFALQAWNGIPETDGRNIWIGWAYTWRYGFGTPTDPWRGAMSVPREVGLVATPDGPRLTQKPVREIETLRGRSVSLRDVLFDAGHDPLDGIELNSKALDIEATFQIRGARRFGLRVLQSGSEHTEIGYDHRLDEMYVNRRHSGATGFADEFIDHLWAPLPPGEDERVTMRILVDHSIVEVFSGDGTRVITARVFPGRGSDGVSLFTDGDDVKIESLTIHEMNSVWEASQ